MRRAGNRNKPLLPLEQNKKPPRYETWRLIVKCCFVGAGAVLLIVVDHFRRGLAHLNLGAHLLDLRGLFFKLGGENLYLFL
jgi:hypothetical protein